MVPNLLEQLKLVAAHLDLLPVLLVDIKETLALLQRLGGILDLVDLGVPLVDFLVAFLTNRVVEGRLLLEIRPELNHFVPKFLGLLLDLLGLQRLQRRELFARIIRDARGGIPAVRRIVHHLDEILGNDHAVLLEQMHLGTQWLEHPRDQVGAQPHVADARHRTQQRLSVIGLDLL